MPRTAKCRWDDCESIPARSDPWDASSPFFIFPLKIHGLDSFWRIHRLLGCYSDTRLLETHLVRAQAAVQEIVNSFLSLQEMGEPWRWASS